MSERICSIDGCSKPTRTGRAEWCEMHYSRWYRRGDPLINLRPKLPFDQRFWSKVDIGGADDCWPWTGATYRHGYGCVRDGSRGRQSHRIAWELTYGDPTDMYVLHRCDNPPCCNPAHLFLGTHADNMRDKVAKGRQSRGLAKLTVDQVTEIRARSTGELGEQKRFAEEYGIDSSAISRILAGHIYR